MSDEDIGRVAYLRIALFEELDELSECSDRGQIREAISSFLRRRLRSGGRLWLHPSTQGRRIYESIGFEGREVEEMQLVLAGRGE